MENNGKGMNIFYGVIGVATLIITIVGATFAYFSATTNSAVNAVTAQGATINLGFDDQTVTGGMKTDLIPVDEEQAGFKKVVGIGENKCKDSNNNNICSVYTFSVSNPATVAQKIFGWVKPQTNEFTNLHMAIFKGTPTDVGENFDVTADAVTTVTTDLDGGSDGAFNKTTTAAAATRKNVIGNPGNLIHEDTHLTLNSTDDIDIPGFTQILDPGEKATYTIVLWIHETGSAQNMDQTAAFAGGVFFTTEDEENQSGVTGIITVS